MGLTDVELIHVLNVLYDRISRLRSLYGRYPNVSLASDWKFEISVLEDSCEKLEKFGNISALSDNEVILPLVIKD